MPRYTFRNTVTGEEKEKYLRIADRETFLLENPEWKQIHLGTDTPSIVSHRDSMIGKTSRVYRDRLKQIKRNSGRFHNIHD